MATPSTSDYGDLWGKSEAFRQLLEDERADADSVVYCCSMCRVLSGAVVPLVGDRCVRCGVEFTLPEAR